jgi:hypothetical protein
LEFIAAVAIGLNPYVAAFVLAALTAFTRHGPRGDVGEIVPAAAFTLLTVLFGLAAPIDFILCKFHRFAPDVRRISQPVAGLTGALFVVSISQLAVPLPILAVGAAVLSWGIATMLTSCAARASRSPSWVGLGHVPILMAAATAAACIVPLGLAKPGLGIALSISTCLPLMWSTLAAARRSWRLQAAGEPGLRRARSAFARAAVR